MAVDSNKAKVFGTWSLGIFTFSFLANVNTTPQLATYGLGAIALFAAAIILFLIPTAMASAELGAGWPRTGGIYVWTKLAFGDRWAFLVIWCEWAGFVIGWPNIMGTMATEAAYTFDPGLSNNRFFIAAVVVVTTWIAALLALKGLKLARDLTWLAVLVGTIAPALLIVVMAIVWIIQGKPSGMEIGTTELVPHIGSGNIAFISGALLMFMGIELSAIHAGDVRNPQRTIPRANAIAVGLCIVLFLPLTLALAVVIPSDQLNIVAGLVEAGRTFFAQYGVPWLDSVLALMLVFGLGIALIQIIGGPSRGLMIAARQGNLPPSLQRENSVGMPTSIIMVQAAISSVLGLCYIFLGSIQNTWFMFLAIQTCISLVVYVLMFSSVIKLRHSRPNVDRPYKIPGGKLGLWLVCGVGLVVALIGIGISLVPTDEATDMSATFYVSFLVIGFLGFLSIPFIVRIFRRPSWVTDEPIVGEEVDAEGDVALSSGASGTKHRK